jgi:hypothetical protein
MHFRRTAFGAVVATLVVCASSAQAQEDTYVERRTDSGQDIRFKDDVMTALVGGPTGSQFRGFHPPRRFDLMPPRTTFVPELLKGIEQL